MTAEQVKKIIEDGEFEYSRRCYGGKHITLIAGYRAECGNDDGEIIIRDAVVLCA